MLISDILMVCRYENPEVALNCGMMLRECVRHEALCKIILYSDEFYNFFGFVEVSTFDIASDAFATFKVGIIWGSHTSHFKKSSIGSLDEA